MPTSSFVFNPPALAGLPVSLTAACGLQPRSVGALQRAAFEEFPTVTVVNIADALEIVQQVVDQIALVIRFLSGFAILGGRDYPGGEHRGDALPPGARGGDFEDARRDPATSDADFFGRIPDAGGGGGTDGRDSGDGVYEPGAEASA